MKAFAHRMIFLLNLNSFHNYMALMIVYVCDLGIHKMAQHLIHIYTYSSNVPFAQTVVATKEYFSIATL